MIVVDNLWKAKWCIRCAKFKAFLFLFWGLIVQALILVNQRLLKGLTFLSIVQILTWSKKNIFLHFLHFCNFYLWNFKPIITKLYLMSRGHPGCTAPINRFPMLAQIYHLKNHLKLKDFRRFFSSICNQINKIVMISSRYRYYHHVPLPWWLNFLTLFFY